MSEGEGQGHPLGAKSSPSLSIEEVHARYRGHWVALRVSALDETHTPRAGQVVAHGSHASVLKALSRIIAPDRQPDALYYLFAAGDCVTSHSALEAAVRAAAGGEPNGL